MRWAVRFAYHVDMMNEHDSETSPNLYWVVREQGFRMPADQKLAVVLGRFQPLHNGHVDLIEQALNIADSVLVVVGSAFRPATPRNPWSWPERLEMLQGSLRADEQARIRFSPIRDYFDTSRWADQLAALVTRHAAEVGVSDDCIFLIGDLAEPSVRTHPVIRRWHNVARQRVPQIDSTTIRRELFTSVLNPVEADQFRELASSVPSTVWSWLQRWLQTDQSHEMAFEWDELEKYRQAWSVAPYPPVFVTADSVVQCQDRVLLVQRRHRPGKGLMALPGGFLDQWESIQNAALRELVEETNLAVSSDELLSALKGSRVCDHPLRSERGRVVTHAYYFQLGDRPFPEIAAADDAADVRWVPIAELSELEDRFHDDHFFILDHFLKLL